MKNIFIALLIVIALIITGCVPSGGSSANPEMLTSAALTVQAAVNSAATLPLPSSTPESNGPAVLTVTEVTNCRKGPGVNFELVVQIVPGEQVNIVGSVAPNYWVVTSKAGECFMIADFATPAGNFATVPLVTPPATPTGSPPSAVDLRYQYNCDLSVNQAAVTLTWNDASSDETGYHVYRDGTLIAELPANTTTYFESIGLGSGQGVTYYVEVFNLLGSERSKIISFSC